MSQYATQPGQASSHIGGGFQQPSTPHSQRNPALGVSIATLIAAAMSAAPLPAGAAGFSGDYDPSYWITTLSPASDGSVDTSNAPTNITITGPNNMQSLSYITYTINAPASGSVSFDWLYSTIDPNPGHDAFGYLINGTQFMLTDDQGTLPSGSASFSVTSGDDFGFYIASTDGDFGAGIATVYNFSGPGSPVPTNVPAPAAVLGVFAAFGWSRKLRRRTLHGQQKASRRQSRHGFGLSRCNPHQSQANPKLAGPPLPNSVAPAG